MAVNTSGEGNEPRRFYAACENEGCGVCGPVRATESAAHADARAHALICSATAGPDVMTAARAAAWLDQRSRA